MQLHDKPEEKIYLKRKIGQEHFVNPDLKAIKENQRQSKEASFSRLCEIQIVFIGFVISKDQK